MMGSSSGGGGSSLERERYAGVGGGKISMNPNIA